MTVARFRFNRSGYQARCSRVRRSDRLGIMRVRISVFVVSYNRASLLESCLRAASFADELIVVDKSSTDASTSVAARYADRVEIVPWSPVVEETRAFALSLCRNEWILFLDDDEERERR